MKRSVVNVRTALRFRQGFIIIFFILCCIILGISAQAKDISPKVDGRASTLKKQNKMYTNACQLLKEKRNKKDKAKAHKTKWR